MNSSAKNVFSLSGIWQAVTEDGSVHTMRLPGTLDENNIGTPEPVAEDATTEQGRYPYARKYVSFGPVRISRRITFEESPGKRCFIDVERSRALRLFADGEEIPPEFPETLPAPAVFEVTGRISGAHMLTFVADNSFPGMPAEELLSSNMASNATVTNWNGLVGTIRIREEEPVFIESVEVVTSLSSAVLRAVINAPYPFEGDLCFESPTFRTPVTVHAEGKAGRTEIRSEEVPFREDRSLFDDGVGTLYPVTARFEDSVFGTSFGIRTFTASPEGFFLNGTPFYLRGETSESLHPETACPPDRKEVWLTIFRQYRAYGVNFVRFASHCPPEAAFSAADECGMLLMPELSHDPGREEPLSEEAKAYYADELSGILRAFGSHPSFVSLGLPFSERETEFVRELQKILKNTRPDLLFALAPDAVSAVGDFTIRRYVPVLFEPDRPLVLDGIGPFSMLPDFREIDLFSGNLVPVKLTAYREKIRAMGRAALWEKYVEESGEAALFRYREAVEKALRDPAVSGILLEGLQDVPGKREKPCGMLTSHLVPKQYPFAAPERFSAFFGEVHLIAGFRTYCFSFHDTPMIPITVINHGKATLQGDLVCQISDGERAETETIPGVSVSPGERLLAGSIGIGPARFEAEGRQAVTLSVKLRFAGREAVYPVFLYRESVPICPESVYETPTLDLRAMEHLKSGGNVLLASELPLSETPVSQVIDRDHPLFQAFPTGEFTDGRWAALSDRPGFRLPDRLKPIIGTLPDGEHGVFGAELFEARVFSGAVLVSSLSLKSRLDRPEAVALLAAIYDYMSSYDFSPTREITIRELQEILAGAKKRQE